MDRRLPRLLTRGLVACASLSLVVALGQAAGASTASHGSLEAQARAAARTALEHLMVGQHGFDQRVAGAHGITGQTSVESTNWSGYADTSETFSSVSGHWTEPTGSCSGFTTSLAAFWVGIDGYSSDSVEQDGTLIECYFGSAYYFSWWEMYPTNDIQVVGESVDPGDSISASVVRSGDSYTLSLTDSTHTANSFSTTQTCSDCDNSSAEWIAEAPSGSAGVYPLTDFHSWTESGATVSTTSSSGVISSYPYSEITMVDSSGNVKAQPSSLNSSGNGFSVTWERSS
jgi:hypothetical protein